MDGVLAEEVGVGLEVGVLEFDEGRREERRGEEGEEEGGEVWCCWG